VSILVSGAGYLGDRKHGSILRFGFSTAKADGVPDSLSISASDDVISVRAHDADTLLLTPLTVDAGSRVGANICNINLNSFTAHYTAGSHFGLFLNNMCAVDSVSVNGAMIGTFGIQEHYAWGDIKPKTDLIPAVPSRSVKKNIQLANLPVMMLDTTTRQPLAGLTVACGVSKDGGALAASSNAVSEVGGGLYKVTITATELNADQVLLLFTATGAEPQTVYLLTTP
jgi:hypothetical protein